MNMFNLFVAAILAFTFWLEWKGEKSQGWLSVFGVLFILNILLGFLPVISNS